MFVNMCVFYPAHDRMKVRMTNNDSITRPWQSKNINAMFTEFTE